MSIPLLDKELWEDYADDEQEEAYDMLQDLKAQCDAKPTMLYINENEELQSYLKVKVDGAFGKNTKKALFEELKNKYNSDKIELKELSMGMTGDYKIALEEGSTMIRVGSAIFGSRNYQ